MHPTALKALTLGSAYRVLIKGQSRTVRRILLRIEQRFGSIPCAVFTTKVRRDVHADWNAQEKLLHLTGSRLPSGELSVPHYEILTCTPD